MIPPLYSLVPLLIIHVWTPIHAGNPMEIPHGDHPRNVTSTTAARATALRPASPRWGVPFFLGEFYESFAENCSCPWDFMALFLMEKNRNVQGSTWQVTMNCHRFLSDKFIDIEWWVFMATSFTLMSLFMTFFRVMSHSFQGVTCTFMDLFMDFFMGISVFFRWFQPYQSYQWWLMEIPRGETSQTFVLPKCCCLKPTIWLTTGNFHKAMEHSHWVRFNIDSYLWKTVIFRHALCNFKYQYHSAPLRFRLPFVPPCPILDFGWV